MKPWEQLDTETLPAGGGSLGLYRRGQEYAIRIGRTELMNSRMHASEDALARLACRDLDTKAARILIGGLGMGFTLAEVLHQRQQPGVADEIIVVELMAAVVRWNHDYLGRLAGNPLADARVRVEVADVGAFIAGASKHYDAIILDVDNGPTALTHPANDGLYSFAGVKSAYRALRPGGVLTVWSAESDASFTRRLQRADFSVEEVRVRARKGRGAHHWIWVARRPKKSTL